ncbi:SsgA family sporulation/cell division regulator [Streptomyces sp. NPDC015171]|uniref:SsgA family sporulation/cell division regulator n=1 Tax=Streptomyces sp. NPDC015171 TaxID=3364945 RepID=UPI0036F68384
MNLAYEPDDPYAVRVSFACPDTGRTVEWIMDRDLLAAGLVGSPVGLRIRTVKRNGIGHGVRPRDRCRSPSRRQKTERLLRSGQVPLVVAPSA